MPRPLNRRDVLLAAAGAVLAAGPAAALSLEDDPARARLYLAACETRNTHDQMIRDLVAQLACSEEVTPEVHAQAVARIKALPCAVCGCALGAIEPYPARF